MATWLGVEAAKKPPTSRHRTAVWECLLGTVYARNDAGEVKYFDYDYPAAMAFAGVTPERMPRVAKAPYNTLTGARTSSGQKKVALFILKVDA
jgi:hypothetical protein